MYNLLWGGQLLHLKLAIRLEAGLGLESSGDKFHPERNQFLLRVCEAVPFLYTGGEGGEERLT